jgi:signal transduction histidine kinase
LDLPLRWRRCGIDENQLPFFESSILSIANVTFAVAVFVVDTQVDVDIDIPVLYVAVVLMSAGLYEGRAIVIVALGCAALTVVGYLLSPGDLPGTTAIANRLLPLSAIGVTAALAVRDQSAQKALRKSETELAHVSRVTTLGELTGSIAHEVNQPITGVVANAEACLLWLDRAPPNLDEARRAAESIIHDGNRAGEVIGRIRALSKKAESQKVPLRINDAVNEAIALVQRELFNQRIALRMGLAPTLPEVLADRIERYRGDIPCRTSDRSCARVAAVRVRFLPPADTVTFNSRHSSLTRSAPSRRMSAPATFLQFDCRFG